MHVAIYSCNALHQVEPDYMKSTAATYLYVGRSPPHTNPPRPNKGKIQSCDY